MVARLRVPRLNFCFNKLLKKQPVFPTAQNRFDCRLCASRFAHVCPTRTLPPPLTLELQVDLCGFPTISNQRFGRAFVDRVANPSEILLFSRRATKKRTVRAGAGQSLLVCTACPVHRASPSFRVHC